MPTLPTQLPRWYQVNLDREKGWTPETTDIVENRENHEIINAWNGNYQPFATKKYTVKIDKLRILSPIQVGGGNFPEGGILPAQFSGIPCIPGSALKGTLLSYLQSIWDNIPSDEQQFWLKLISPDNQSWQPKAIRFESIFLKNLKPYPLNPQQPWQIFNERDNKLGIQWQVSNDKPVANLTDKFSLEIVTQNKLNEEEKQWLKQRSKEMLENFGIGKGRRSGFGRLADFPADGKWEIHLTGMKPCVQSHNPKIKQNGKYRWTPQVLRANLRGYFTRICLSLLSKENANELTKIIFGGLGCPAKLTLTSFLASKQRGLGGGDGYTNIPASDAHETWVIKVDCNPEFEQLIGDLLELASRLGGLGAGWRRTPHKLERFGGFRGSEFNLTYSKNTQNNSNKDISNLILDLQEQITALANTYRLNVFANKARVNGGIVSIWQNKDKEAWEYIVHNVCSTHAHNRPSWCGDSQNRPSGYAVRQYQDFCLITVFDLAVEATLRRDGFIQIY